MGIGPLYSTNSVCSEHKYISKQNHKSRHYGFSKVGAIACMFLVQNDFHVGKKRFAPSRADIINLFSQNVCEIYPMKIKNTYWSYHVCIQIFY